MSNFKVVQYNWSFEEMEDEDEGGDPIVPKKSLKPKCPNPCPDNKAGDGLEAKETKDSQGNKVSLETIEIIFYFSHLKLHTLTPYQSLSLL